MKITENQGHRCGSSACKEGLASLRSARLFMRFALIKREGGSESLYPLLFVFERTLSSNLKYVTFAHGSSGYIPLWNDLFL